MSQEKRNLDVGEDDTEEQDEWVGPRPAEASQPKRQRGKCVFDLLFCDWLICQ